MERVLQNSSLRLSGADTDRFFAISSLILFMKWT